MKSGLVRRVVLLVVVMVLVWASMSTALARMRSSQFPERDDQDGVCPDLPFGRWSQEHAPQRLVPHEGDAAIDNSVHV